jgi:quercetin dioxygenase-like cupin family protein
MRTPARSWQFSILIVAALTVALAQDAARPATRHNVNFGTVQVDGPFDVIQMVLDLAPGAQTPIHTHGGPELALVLEGQITLVLEAAGSETAYGAGEWFRLPADTVLQVANRSDAPATFVATFLLPAGAPLTTVR